jgi:hypothetical protein
MRCGLVRRLWFSCRTIRLADTAAGYFGSSWAMAEPRSWCFLSSPGLSSPGDLLSRLREQSHQKRIVLSNISHHNAKISKILYLLSAFIALISGTSAAGQAAKAFEAYWFKDYTSGIVAILALVSGVISLFTTLLFPLDATHRLYRGAVDFLALREEIDIALNKPNTTDKQLFSAYKRLDHRYIHLCHEYEPYFAAHHARSKFPANPVTVVSGTS